MQTRPGPLLLGMTLALATGPLFAHDEDGPDAVAGDGHHAAADEQQSHDRARRAMQNGEILPIATILQRIHAQAPGRILHTELEHEHGQWIYEIKFLDPKGRLYELEIAARNGEILRRWEGQ